MGVKIVQTSSRTKLHLFLLLIVIGFFIWSAIKPVRYSNWALEVSPAVVGVIIAVIMYKKFRLTTLSYFIITILSVVVFIGGHYIYSNVPMFDWIKEQFDLGRNLYDRFGHFLKGLLAIVIREILLRKTPLTKGFWVNIIAISMILAIAMLYEISEWLFSYISHGGRVSKDFLGTQGDIWDTQWDSTLTLVGSILSLLFFTKLHNRQLKKEVNTEP
ncbi:DUF2238 domain-containing protein [Bacillus sp. V5-8f]|uniref:DUF2238 domain-containing protein n=1 Tax=Bacillus sp. V5-8f TaxID=2053044 RepID=UPI000C763663|nr:DUF2238 domain-containing protein [Bacillus sp. V5-8f]PLT35649.1 DUF2238 domain-containing protein [Bacillus sp. V5-8f]